MTLATTERSSAKSETGGDSCHSGPVTVFCRRTARLRCVSGPVSGAETTTLMAAPRLRRTILLIALAPPLGVGDGAAGARLAYLGLEGRSACRDRQRSGPVASISLTSVSRKLTIASWVAGSWRCRCPPRRTPSGANHARAT